MILEKQEVFQDQSKHQRKVKQKRFLLKMMIQIKEMLRKSKMKTRKISTMIRKDLEFFLIVKNQLTETIKAMKENLEKETNLKVIFEPEFMTSVQASQITGENKMLDASAAAIILQSYLNKIKNSPTKLLVPGKAIFAIVNIKKKTEYIGIKCTKPP